MAEDLRPPESVPDENVSPGECDFGIVHFRDNQYFVPLTNEINAALLGSWSPAASASFTNSSASASSSARASLSASSSASASFSASASPDHTAPMLADPPESRGPPSSDEYHERLGASDEYHGALAPGKEPSFYARRVVLLLERRVRLLERRVLEDRNAVTTCPLTKKLSFCSCGYHDQVERAHRMVVGAELGTSIARMESPTGGRRTDHSPTTPNFGPANHSGTNKFLQKDHSEIAAPRSHRLLEEMLNHSKAWSRSQLRDCIVYWTECCKSLLQQRNDSDSIIYVV